MQGKRPRLPVAQAGGPWRGGKRRSRHTTLSAMLRGSCKSGLGVSSTLSSSLLEAASGCGMSCRDLGPDEGSALGVPAPPSPATDMVEAEQGEPKGSPPQASPPLRGRSGSAGEPRPLESRLRFSAGGKGGRDAGCSAASAVALQRERRHHLPPPAGRGLPSLPGLAKSPKIQRSGGGTRSNFTRGDSALG